MSWSKTTLRAVVRRWLIILGSVFFKSFCTLYSVVFEPATGRAWVAEGLLPATRGPYRKVATPRR